MKRILIPTDFSGHSKHTIQYVISLFKDINTPCKISLIHTYKVQQTDPDKVIYENDEMKKRSRSALEEERDEAMKLISNANISIDISSHMGSLNNVVEHLLQKEKIDLVVMGKNKGKHVEMISHILKQQQCPLLITYIPE